MIKRLVENVRRPFEVRGVHHLALVSRDMARTVAFYRNVLGFELTRGFDLPDGSQHFFFDIGAGNSLAFFWFPNRKDAKPGVSAPAHLPGAGDFTSAPGSMNHVAFTVPIECLEAYRDRLRDHGVACSEIMNHDWSPAQVSSRFHEGVWLRSIYFMDPDGCLLEFASWSDAETAVTLVAEPRNFAGERVPLERDPLVARGYRS